MFAPSSLITGKRISAMPPHYFKVVPPAALRQHIYRTDPDFNSAWDMLVTPEGRVFIAICAELSVSRSAKFCEFIPATGEFIERFDVGRVTMAFARSMPQSKIHTSMSVLPDGRILMTTHTTAAAPGHPSWMIDSFYNHLWEGYQGSHVLIYDPRTCAVENLGMPVPRDTVYGGAYDARHHRFYFTTLMRGVVYALDLATREVKELGQATEFGTFRILPGSDGHFYLGSRTGRLTRINTDRVALEDTGIEVPYDAGDRYERTQRVMTYGTTGPDGALYFTACYVKNLFRYDPRTGELRTLGEFTPRSLGHWEYPRIIQGLAFDREGVLWYTCTTSAQSDHLGTHLVSWRLDGGEPVNHGLIGTTDRVAIFISELHLHQDTLYLADTNHGNDGPAMVMVDLAKLRGRSVEASPENRDAKIYIRFEDYKERFPEPEFLRRAQEYEKAVRHYMDSVEIVAKNPFDVRAKSYRVVYLWRHLPAAESRVRLLWWRDAHTLCGVSGEKELRQWTIERNQWQGSVPFQGSLEKLADELGHAELRDRKIQGAPFHCGRQYLSRITAAAPWTNGSYLVGTEDSMVGRVDGGTGRCYSFGGLDTHGPVRQIVSDRARSLAYGISGDPMDIGRLFVYHDTWGLRTVGRFFHFAYDLDGDGFAGSNRLSALALSPDDATLAVGSEDRMACVYLLQGIEPFPFESHLGPV